MKINIKRLLSIASVVFIVGIAPTLTVDAQSLPTPKRLTPISSNLTYIQTNTVDGKIFQRSLQSESTLWRNVSFPSGYTPISAVTVAKNLPKDTKSNATFVLQGVIAKDKATNINHIFRRTFVKEYNYWSPWIIDTKINVASDSKLEIVYRKFTNASSMFITIVRDEKNDLQAQYSSEDGVLWSDPYLAGQNAIGDFSVFHATSDTTSRDFDTTFITYVNASNTLTTVYSRSIISWVKFNDSLESDTKNIKTVVLNNPIISSGFGGEQKLADKLMPLQVRRGSDNYLYYRALNCYTRNSECTFSTWQSTGDRTQDDFSLIKLDGQINRFLVSLKGMDNNGYTSIYEARIESSSNFDLKYISGELTGKVDSNIVTDNYTAKNGKAIFQTVIRGGKIQSRVLNVSVDGSIIFEGAKWITNGRAKSLAISGINL